MAVPQKSVGLFHGKSPSVDDSLPGSPMTQRKPLVMLYHALSSIPNRDLDDLGISPSAERYQTVQGHG